MFLLLLQQTFYAKENEENLLGPFLPIAIVSKILYVFITDPVLRQMT